MRAVLLMMIEELDVIQIVVIGVIVKVQLLRSQLLVLLVKRGREGSKFIVPAK